MCAHQMDAYGHVVGSGMGGQCKGWHVQQIPEANKGMVTGTGKICRRLARRQRSDERICYLDMLRQASAAI